MIEIRGRASNPPDHEVCAMSHPELSPVQLQKFTTLFRLYDRDGDGAITVSDYVGVADRFTAALTASRSIRGLRARSYRP